MGNYEYTLGNVHGNPESHVPIELDVVFSPTYFDAKNDVITLLWGRKRERGEKGEEERERIKEWGRGKMKGWETRRENAEEIKGKREGHRRQNGWVAERVLKDILDKCSASEPLLMYSYTRARLSFSSQYPNSRTRFLWCTVVKIWPWNKPHSRCKSIRLTIENQEILAW